MAKLIIKLYNIVLLFICHNKRSSSLLLLICHYPVSVTLAKKTNTSRITNNIKCVLSVLSLLPNRQ